MESELKNLLEERAISNQLSRLARILDTRKWEDLKNIYTEDVVFSYPGEEEKQGVDAIQEDLEAFFLNCGPTQHMLSGDLITTFEDGKAISSVYAQAVHQGKDEYAHLFYNAYGAYEDEWIKQGDQWKIAKRRFRIFQVQGDIRAMGTSKTISTDK
jgi:SnoaL-like polyketide cyclase.